MTDGYENASHEWTHPAIKALIGQQTETYGLQFMYMGADQDAIEVGTGLGFAADQSITYARGKAGDAIRTTSAKVGAYRQARAAGMPQAAAQEYLAHTDFERGDLGSDN